jgi:hypothetical protein
MPNLGPEFSLFERFEQGFPSLNRSWFSRESAIKLITDHWQLTTVHCPLERSSCFA